MHSSTYSEHSFLDATFFHNCLQISILNQGSNPTPNKWCRRLLVSVSPGLGDKDTGIAFEQWLQTPHSFLSSFPLTRSELPSLITLPQNLKAHFLFCFAMSNLHSHSRGMDQFLHLQFLPRPPFSKASKTKKANHPLTEPCPDSSSSLASHNKGLLTLTLPSP